MTGIEPRPQRWEARVLPLSHRGPEGVRSKFTRKEGVCNESTLLGSPTVLGFSHHLTSIFLERWPDPLQPP